MSRTSGVAERSEVVELASPVSGAALDMCALAGSGAAPQALLVVLEFVACFSGTQETPWRLCRPCSPVRPHHGSLAYWLGHLATLGFVFIQHIF